MGGCGGDGRLVSTRWPTAILRLRVRRRVDIAARIDHLCFSYEVTATKPDPHAYLATLKRLNVTPELCLFVDDAESNVRGARSVGIDAIQFVDAPALANELHQRQFL